MSRKRRESLNGAKIKKQWIEKGIVFMKSSYKIVLSPLITEKNTRMAEQNKFVFWVDMKANKIEIRKAIEDIFNVHVTKVNTSKIKSKLKRVRAVVGKTAERKKAIVTLKQGDSISFV